MIKHHLDKRGSTYQVIFWINGERIRKSTRATKKADAQAVAEMIINKHLEDHYGKSNHTLLQLIDTYINLIKVENKGWKDKVPRLKLFSDKIGDKNLSDITHHECQEFINKLKGSDRSPATINRYVATYLHMFNKGIDYEMISVNPFRKIKKSKEKARLRFFTEEEIKRILHSAKNLEKTSESPNRKSLYYIILTAIYTGMRLSEILNLRWMDFREDTFIIHNSKSGQKRIVPAHPELLKELLELNTGNEYIFDLNRRAPDVITKLWKKVREEAKVKDARFHDLRHFFASQLIKNQASIVSVQELLGHTDIKTTMIYSHSDQNQKKEAIKKLKIK